MRELQVTVVARISVTGSTELRNALVVHASPVLRMFEVAVANQRSCATFLPPVSRSLWRAAVTLLVRLYDLSDVDFSVEYEAFALFVIIFCVNRASGVAKDVGKMAGELKDVPAEFQVCTLHGESFLQCG